MKDVKGTSLSLGVLLGVGLAVVVLLVSLARIAVVDRIEARAAEAGATQRLNRGLASTAAFLSDERTRTLLSAEAATAAPGLGSAVADGDPARTLALLQTLRRSENAAMLAAADSSGKILAADPATNLSLVQSAPLRQALAGRSASGLVEDNGTFVLVAAAPLRDGGSVVGASLSLQRLDDALLTSATRDSGLAAALVSNGRVVAASSAIRTRYAQDRGKQVSLMPGATGQPERLAVGATKFDVASQALYPNGNGPDLTLAVGRSADEALLSPRPGLDLWSAVVAALLAGLIGWLVGRGVGAGLLGLQAGKAETSRLPGAEAARLAAGLAEERAGAAARIAAARDEAARLRAILDAVGEGIIVSNRDRQVVLTNAAARSLLGLNGSGANAVMDLLPPEGMAEIRANARVLRSYSTPIAGPDQPGGVVTVLHDATAERESERVRGELLSVVSHELQTPLTAIVGAADLLLDEPDRFSAEQTRFLTTIRRNGDRLIALVSDLLDVSRLASGRVELDLQPLDLETLVRASIRAMANLFEQKSQSVILDAGLSDEQPLPPVLGDRRRLEQILANLLSNAGHYTQPGGRISVELRRSAGEVVLAVADNGPGISQADLPHVFEAFYRGTGPARRERGSGLGLAIVRSLVELHQGRVWVESAPGEGTCFFVALAMAGPEDE